MEKIELKSFNVIESKVFGLKGVPAEHLYLVYTDSNDNQFIYRAGPGELGYGGSALTVTVILFQV